MSDLTMQVNNSGRADGKSATQPSLSLELGSVAYQRLRQFLGVKPEPPCFMSQPRVGAGGQAAMQAGKQARKAHTPTSKHAISCCTSKIGLFHHCARDVDLCPIKDDGIAQLRCKAQGDQPAPRANKQTSEQAGRQAGKQAGKVRLSSTYICGQSAVAC